MCTENPGVLSLRKPPHNWPPPPPNHVTGILWDFMNFTGFYREMTRGEFYSENSDQKETLI